MCQWLEKVMLESVRVRPLACPGIGCAKRLVLAKIVTKRIKLFMKGATTAGLGGIVNGGYITTVEEGSGWRMTRNPVVRS